jgi:PKD repeat protein
MINKTSPLAHPFWAVQISSRTLLIRKRYGWAVVLALFLGLLLATAPVSAASTCAVTNAGSYEVTVCIDSPDDGASLQGEQSVNATVSVTGSSPGVQKLLFYLGGEYLITDYESDYTFVLPSDHFVDGMYTLEVEAVMRDTFVSDRTSINLTFNNGVTTPPINNSSFTPYRGSPTPGQPFVVAATGDGASGRMDALAVSDLLVAHDPDMLLYLGDVYEDGTYTEFWNWYGNGDTFFSRLKAITNPTLGNHEVSNGQAPGYFFYWDNVPNYYSFDTAGWHIINLNTNSYFDQFEPGTAQYDWLVQDLRNANSACTLTFMHHPVYNVGDQGDTPRLNSIWALMDQYNVDLVLAGHDHNYQRWQPLNGAGNPSNNGIVQFVAGAGGHGVRPFVRTDNRMVTGYDTAPQAFGSLFMTLNPAGAEFQYVNIFEETLDSGVVPCVGAPQDRTPPSVPTLTASVNDASQAVLNWTASSDNTGVASYTIYRDGTALTTVNGATTSFLDSSVWLNENYSYTVEAFDPDGNGSGRSNAVSITTLATGVNTINPTADTYVNQGNPDFNYGTAAVLRTDMDPDTRSYLRFDVQNLVGAIDSATLRVFANSNSNIGYELRQVADNSWGELSMTYANAPAVGPVLGASGAFMGGGWTEIDVTEMIMQEGLVSFAMTGLSSAGISYSSRQGAMPPELVITTVDNYDAPQITIDRPTVAIDEGMIASNSGTLTNIAGSNSVTVAASAGDITQSAGRWSWSFTTADGPAESQTIIITVDNGHGGVASTAFELIVNNVAPVVNAGTDRIVPPGTSLAFAGSFSDPGTLDTHTIAWDFGDGTGASGTLTPSHVYTIPGIYTVTLSVTDSDNATTNDTLIITVGIDLLTNCLFAAEKDVKLDDDTVVDCNVSAVGKVDVKKRVNMIGNVVSISDSVKIGEDTTVTGDVTAADKIEVHSTATINGSSNPFTTGTVPELPAFTISANGSDVKITASNPALLTPGEYANLKVEKNAAVELSGIYTLKKFEAGNDAAIYISGPTVIYVEKEVKIQDRVTMFGNPTDLLVIVAGKDIDFEKESQVIGTYIAPNTKIELHDNASITGALYGKQINIKKKATVLGAPAIGLYIDTFLSE